MSDQEQTVPAAKPERRPLFARVRYWFEHLCQNGLVVNNRLYQDALRDLAAAGERIVALEEDVERLDSLVADAGDMLTAFADQLEKNAKVIAAVGLKHNELVKTVDGLVRKCANCKTYQPIPDFQGPHFICAVCRKEVNHGA